MTLLLAFACTGIVVTLIYYGWSYRTLIRLRKRKDQGSEVILNEKYFELKYKSEFLIASFWVLAAAGGFFGYSAYEDIKNDVKDQIVDETKELHAELGIAQRNVHLIDSLVHSIKDTVNAASTLMKETATSMNLYKDDAQRISGEQFLIEERIRQLNEKDLQLDYYTITGLSIPSSDYVEGGISIDTFYFEKMQTTAGEKLPRFVNPPLVIPSSESEYLVTVYNVTTTSFTVINNNEANNRRALAPFNVLIFSGND